MFIYLFSTIDLPYRRSENNYSAFHHHPFVFTLISTKANVLLLDGILFISYCRWKQCNGSGMQRQSSGLLSALFLLAVPFARHLRVCVRACFFLPWLLFSVCSFLFRFLLLRHINNGWHTIMLYKTVSNEIPTKTPLRYHYNICWMRLCTCWLYEINWKETEPRRNKAHFPLNLS